MRQFSYTIKAPAGIHAIPAALLAQEAKKFKSFISIANDTAEADITKLLKVIAMSIKKGDTVLIHVEGDDEELAAGEMEAFFQKYL